MTSPLSAARAFVEEHYPDAVMAFLGGSAATGTTTATSDLDVLILLSDDFGDVAFVETTTHQGWLVEAFVYGPVAAEHWIRRGRRERRPVLDTLAASGSFSRVRSRPGTGQSRPCEFSLSARCAGAGRH